MAAVQSSAAQAVLTVAGRQQGTKDLQKTRLCIYHLQGKCGSGSACTFAHSAVEVREVPDLKKTQLCSKFAEGKCTDENCSFAHGEADLREPPNFKKKLCKWHAKGLCRNGAKCGFAHSGRELRGAPPGLEPPAAQAKSPLGAPPGLTADWASTAASVSPSLTECDVAAAGAPVPAVPEEPLFRLAAGRGAAPLQQQVTMMTSAIAALQGKLAQLEGMMVQTQVSQLQQEIQQLSGQCWALETGLCLAQQPPPLPAAPTPLRSRLSTKAAPFVPSVPSACVGDAASDDSTSVGSGSD